MSAVSMGADAENMMTDLLKSFDTSNKAVKYRRTAIPALASKLNVIRSEPERS